MALPAEGSEGLWGPGGYVARWRAQGLLEREREPELQGSDERQLQEPPSLVGRARCGREQAGSASAKIDDHQRSWTLG